MGASRRSSKTGEWYSYHPREFGRNRKITAKPIWLYSNILILMLCLRTKSTRNLYIHWNREMIVKHQFAEAMSRDPVTKAANAPEGDVLLPRYPFVNSPTVAVKLLNLIYALTYSPRTTHMTRYSMFTLDSQNRTLFMRHAKSYLRLSFMLASGSRNSKTVFYIFSLEFYSSNVF